MVEVREKPYLINVPTGQLGFDGGHVGRLDEVVAEVCPDLPDLSVVRSDAQGNRNYDRLLQTVPDRDGKPRGWTVVAALSIFVGDLNGPTFMSLRGPNRTSQPNVLGASATGRVEIPKDRPKETFLTRAVGSLSLSEATDQKHVFDFLRPDAWRTLPEDGPSDVLGAMVEVVLDRRLRLGVALRAGDISCKYAAESLGLGVAVNGQRTGKDGEPLQELELPAMESIAVVLPPEAIDMITSPDDTPELVQGTQAEIARTMADRDLRHLSGLPTTRHFGICTGGRCIVAAGGLYERVDRAREQGVDLRALTA